MKITNIDLTNPNWREQVDKHIQETEHIKMIEETRNISTMSGGLDKTPVTTTTTSAVSNSATIPVASRSGIINNISTMSGGLELRLYTILPKVYRKIINKLQHYKKNTFD